MGAYFTIIGVDRVSREDAVTEFRQLESSEGTLVELFPCESGAIVVIVDDMLYDSQAIVSQLSSGLCAPVILLSYSDDVVWSYELFRDGKRVDRYSSSPTYWDAETKEEDFEGSASTVASVWTDVEVSQIEGYLTNKESIPENKSSEKAYQDDEHEQWDAWQMCDFMRKLGLTYPVNEDGELISEAIASFTISTESGRSQKAESDAKMAEALATFKAMQDTE